MNWLKKIDLGIWITIATWIFAGFVWGVGITKDFESATKDIDRNRKECIERNDSLKDDLKEIKRDIKILLRGNLREINK